MEDEAVGRGDYASGGSVAAGVDEASIDKVCDLGRLTMDLEWLRKTS